MKLDFWARWFDSSVTIFIVKGFQWYGQVELVVLGDIEFRKPIQYFWFETDIFDIFTLQSFVLQRHLWDNFDLFCYLYDTKSTK